MSVAPYAVEISNLSFSYPGHHDVRVLDGISLTIPSGELVCVIGRSGCGKSTFLNILAGLLPVTSGKVLLSDKPLGGPGTDRSVVFQHYSLFPWMTALQNVLFGIRQARGNTGRAERLSLAEEYLRKVGMWDDRDKYPFRLSGGMRQRVAIARALAMDADLLLLDEPFGALDAQRRAELQRLLEDLWRTSARPKTIVLVTHDIEEAILLADRILFIRDGKIGADIRVPHQRPRRQGELSRNDPALKNMLLNMFHCDVPNSGHETCH